MTPKSKMLPIPKGTLLTITTGEYSDFYIKGVFRAKEDIDPEAMRMEWLAPREGYEDDWKFDCDKFLGWVFQRGVLEPVECTEWYIGQYSNVDNMTVNQIQTKRIVKRSMR